MEDTIAAISTPTGSGAISVIRLSGSESWNIARSILRRNPEKKAEITLQPNRSSLGYIYDGDRLLDEVMTVAFKGPRSYTGEDMVELSCHGSVFIQRELLGLLVRCGARIAQPGEFTRRAYLNAKLDLSQAEAVGDLIAASGKAAHQLAMSQMRGGISNELERVREQLLNFTTLIELELDFSEEDVEFADRTRFLLLTEDIIYQLDRLIKTFEAGNAVKSGVPVAITGETNVGKSTLLNLLLKEEKAIVSDIAGTTRDVIEDCIHLNGIEFRFIDTAGIRETTNEIEVIGIERALQQITRAKIVILMTAVNAWKEDSLNLLTSRIMSLSADQQLVVVINKSDLDPQLAETLSEKIKPVLPEAGAAVIPLSAKTGQGIRELENVLLEMVNAHLIDSAEVIVTNARHYEALVRSRDAIHRCRNGIYAGITGDFLAQDLREAMHYLGEITGTFSSDEVLANIFSNFCIGK